MRRKCDRGKQERAHWARIRCLNPDDVHPSPVGWLRAHEAVGLVHRDHLHRGTAAQPRRGDRTGPGCVDAHASARSLKQRGRRTVGIDVHVAGLRPLGRRPAALHRLHRQGQYLMLLSTRAWCANLSHHARMGLHIRLLVIFFSLNLKSC